MFESLQILLIVIIAILIASYIYVTHAMDYINNNWSEYRCQPMFMFLAGAMGHDADENNKHCATRHINYVADKHSKKTSEIVKLYDEGMNTFKKYIVNFGDQLTKLNTSHDFAISSIKKKINDVLSVIYYLVEKLKIIMKKLLAIATVIIYTLFSSVIVIKSMMGGVVGGIDSIIEGKCFSGDTIINGTKIKDLELDDNVFSVMNFKYNKKYIYEYNKIKVTGDHLVLEDNYWKYVKDSNKAKKVPFNEQRVYCLITKDNCIKIKDTIFSDFISVHGNISNAIRNKVLESVNKKIIKNTEIDYNEYYESGVLETQIINTVNGYKQMNELSIGDNIPYYGEITGIVKQRNENWISIDNTFTTPGQIILYNNNWIKAIDHPMAIKHKFSGNCISINTTMGMYRHSTISLLHYDEIPNDAIEDKIIEVLNNC